MAPALLDEWTELRSRPVGDGEVILAERMRRAEVGPESIIVAQYATWFCGPTGFVSGRYFDERLEAEQDFGSRL